MEPLTIVVITHNRLEYTKRTIESLLKTCPQGTRFLVWDNKSDEPGMGEYLSSFAINDPHDSLITLSSTNAGWGAAVNQALRDVKTEFVLISNNDVVYHPQWYETCLELYKNHPDLGILGVWKHTAHGVRADLGDMLVKDNMPAVGWLMKMSVIHDIGAFPEHGPSDIKGGNGEDTGYVIKAQEKRYLVAGPKEDVATHIDGY